MIAVEPLNHLDGSSRIFRQCQQIDPITESQAKHYGCVSQRIERSVLSSRCGLQVGALQDNIELTAHHLNGSRSILHIGEEYELVARYAMSLRFVVFPDPPVDPYCALHGYDRAVVGFGTLGLDS